MPGLIDNTVLPCLREQAPGYALGAALGLPRPRAESRPALPGPGVSFAGFSQDPISILRSTLRCPLEEPAPFKSELQFQHKFVL